MQAAASSVCFLTASHVLASAGLDEQLMLLDRRSNSVAASVGVKRPLHSMACRDDGTTIAVGAAGACGIQLYTDSIVCPVYQCSSKLLGCVHCVSRCIVPCVLLSRYAKDKHKAT